MSAQRDPGRPGRTAVDGAVDAAIDALRDGNPVLLMDGRATRGHLMVAAEMVTPDVMNRLISTGTSVVYVCVTADQARSLGLGPQTRVPTGRWTDSVLVSVEAREGVTTGISAADRARTARALADPASTAASIVTPGHLFPVAARAHGLMARLGRTEAGTDLARMAGLWPAVVACDLVDDEGNPLSGGDVRAYAEAHGLPCITVLDVARALLRYERSLWLSGWSQLVVGGRAGLGRHVFGGVQAGPHRLVWLDTRPAVAVSRLVVHEVCATGELQGNDSCRCVRALWEAVAALEPGPGTGLLVLSAPQGHTDASGDEEVRHPAASPQDLAVAGTLDALGFDPPERIETGPYVSLRAETELIARADVG